MIALEDMIKVMKAVELLHYGVDITKLDKIDYFYNIKTKKLQEKITDNVGNFIMGIDNRAKDFLEWVLGDYIIRDKKVISTATVEGLTDEEKATVNCMLDFDTLKQVMTILKRKGWASFSGYKPEVYDDEYLDHLKELQNHWDRYNTDGAKEMIDALSHDRVKPWFHALLTMSKYDGTLAEKIIHTFDSEFEWQGHRSIDGRIYMAVAEWEKQLLRDNNPEYSKYIDDIKYIVISRNPYDYYYCSYGSNIQSCFSLNSSNKGWYGMVALSAARGNCIVYGTTGKPNQINIINGKKWSVPRMLFRWWGWLDENDDIRFDKVYAGNEYNGIFSNIASFVADVYFGKNDELFSCSSTQVKLKYAKEMKEIWDTYHCHFYPDSINTIDFKFYGKGGGNRCFVGACPLNRNLLDIMRQITSVPDTFTYTTFYQIISGELSSIKVCPKTGLPIKADEEQSPYAKYFKDNVSHVLVMTYCDGYYKGDMGYIDNLERTNLRWVLDNDNQSYRESNGRFFITKIFSRDIIGINSFKQMITALAKGLDIDAILVRYIEGERVSVVKYRGNKQ